MYQASLFSDNLHRTAKFLASGCYSSAFEMSNGDVVKTGVNDMTRNWLEFCAMHTAAGTRHRLMPEVYSVVAINDGRYMATMPKFETFRSVRPDSGHPEYGQTWNMNQHPEFAEVRDMFRQYLENLGWCKDWDDERLFNDIHSGNVMFDKTGQLVITDPCAHDYHKMVEVPRFTLQ